MRVPHALNKLGQLLPVHQISVALELALLHLDKVLLGNWFFLVDGQGFLPLLKLFVPVFFVFSQQVFLGVVQNSFCRFRLL